MDSYQSLLGLSELSADLFRVDTLLVQKDLTVFGGSTLLTPIFPTGAAIHKVLTCNTIQGDAVWQDPADAVLAGDCVGSGSSNQVNTLAGGTIPVNTLATLTGTQTLSNKTLDNFTVSGVETLQKNMWFNNQLNTKMIDLWDSGVPSDQTQHNFYGFGISLGELRHHVAGITASHVFYTGTSGTTSTELFRIGGNRVITIPGTLKLTSGAAAGSVLTSDATGNASWLAPAVTTSVGDLTMSGKLLDPLGKYLLARSGNSVFMGGAGMNIFNQNNLAIGNNACSTINAFGFCALGHVAIGNNSLLNSAGNYNCAVGLQSCLANTSGSNNCGFGTSVLATNTVGNNCTAMGHGSGASITAGFNTCVGAYSDVSGGITNATALGYQATCTANDTIQLGNSSVTAVNTSGTINTPALVAGTLNAGASTLSTLTASNLNAGPTTLESLVVGAGTTLAGLNAGATTVTTLNAGATTVAGLTANATTLASLTVNGNTLLQTLGVLSTISCQYGISCGSLSFPSGGATALSYFEEYNHTGTFLINTSESPSFTLKISRVGRTVNCTILSSWTSPPGVYSGPMTMFQAIPARFVPSVAMDFSIVVYTPAMAMGYCTVRTDGLIQIQPPGGFSTSGTPVGYRATAFSYQV